MLIFILILIDSRFSSWLLGLSDEERERRREHLEKWFAEILSSSIIMLNLETVKIIHKFLELSTIN